MVQNLFGERRSKFYYHIPLQIIGNMKSPFRFTLASLISDSLTRHRDIIRKQILAVDYNFDAEVWGNRSQEGKDFVSALLELDERKRLSAEQALRHPWFSSEANLSHREPDLDAIKCTQTRLVQYAESGEFRKVVLNVMAKRATTDDILGLRDIFNEYDTNKDGTISFGEWKKALAQSNLSDEMIQSIFRKLVSEVSGNSR